MVVELNKEYSSKEVAEICEVSYQNFRQNREKQEQHLLNYFDYKKIRRGNGYYYIFTEQIADFIPFKKAKSAKRDKIIKSQIKKTIAKNNRQTGSNIARIICVNEEIVALNLKLNTLQNYTRENLKELVSNGYYSKGGYVWCYLNVENNMYIELTEEEVKELRSYFKATKEEEDLYSDFKEGNLNEEEATMKIGKIRIKTFTDGIEKYRNKYGYRPLKVPVYERNALKEE